MERFVSLICLVSITSFFIGIEIYDYIQTYKRKKEEEEKKREEEKKQESNMSDILRTAEILNDIKSEGGKCRITEDYETQSDDPRFSDVIQNSEDKEEEFEVVSPVRVTPPPLINPLNGKPLSRISLVSSDSIRSLGSSSQR